MHNLNINLQRMMLLAVVMFVGVHALTFSACGNYCGPGWCADTWIDETPCVNQGYWGSDDDGSCIDQCCKAHDYCCGAGDRSQCNDMIANCAYYCSGPCADAVWSAMRLIDTFCCGGPCDQSTMDILETKFGKRAVDVKEGK